MSGSCVSKSALAPEIAQLLKRPGVHNPADMFTKAVNGERIDRHLAASEVHWEPGRGSLGPWTR
eukprot:130311-Alexandrium_andersonii.AAC.1